MVSSVRRLPGRQCFLALPFIALFMVLFWLTFVWMAERFDAHDSFYSHGWLVPAASGWLVWQRRELLKTAQLHASFLGVAFLVPVLLLHIVATWWGVHFVSGFAMVAAVWGLVWTCWGWRAVSILRFPLLFLLFMVPLPGVTLIAISFQMKLFAASLATWVLKLIGIPALQAGSTIRVPGISVIVDDTCSGLRSLVSLIALSILWTSLMPPSSKRWQKLALVAASIPISLAANMIRIIVLVLLSAIYGPQIADSFIHYGSGMVVFGVAVAALAWLSKSLVKPDSSARVAGALS